MARVDLSMHHAKSCVVVAHYLFILGDIDDSEPHVGSC
jgi:hypothetical protein